MKRTLFLLVALLTVAITQLYAQWDGTSEPWTQGNGTAADPYLIQTPGQLAFLADMVSGGISTYSGVYFLQTNDINLSNRSWIPIGNADHPFQGNYNGGGFRIDSMLVNNDTYTHKGLFGYASNGCIKNVNCHGVLLSNCKYQAIIVAEVNNEDMDNNQSYGSITASYAVFVDTLFCSGVVGKVEGSSYISRCSNHADIIFTTGYQGFIGGVVGRANQTTPIYECSNTGAINGMS